MFYAHRRFSRRSRRRQPSCRRRRCFGRNFRHRSRCSLCRRRRSHAAADNLAAAAALDFSLVVVAADLAATDLAATYPPISPLPILALPLCDVVSFAASQQSLFVPPFSPPILSRYFAVTFAADLAAAPLAAAAVFSAADVSVDITHTDFAAVVLVTAASLPLFPTPP